MKIEVAKHSGFCYGVNRAVDILDEIVADNESHFDCFTLGPIIHNSQVTEYYEKKGVKVIENFDDFVDNRIDGAKVVIRSHGAPQSIYDKAALHDINIVDATCPYVKKTQKIVSNYYNKGYTIIVVGDPNHPEIIGINGWCNNEGIVISSVSDIPEQLPPTEKYCVVSQTTIKISLWNGIVEKLEALLPNLVVKCSICKATEERQKACTELAHRVDQMIVIGGKHSSNTQKLYEICSKIVKTIFIETKDDLDISDLRGSVKIGITAGASTPDWIIDSVVLKIENEGEVFFDGKS